jgi:hypothetical protein
MRGDRFLESLSLSHITCPECDIYGVFTLEERKPVKITCMHCKGDYLLEGDKLEPCQYDNIRPIYLDDC